MLSSVSRYLGLFLCAILLSHKCSSQQALPTKAQLAWHNMNYYWFMHFGPNTFTNKEWGHGDEPEDAFNPMQPDCMQWARLAKAGGAKGIIITAKHHDGEQSFARPITSASFIKGFGRYQQKLRSPQQVNCIVLSEDIKRGQQISRFTVSLFRNDSLISEIPGSTIGHKRIINFPTLFCDSIELEIPENAVKRKRVVVKSYLLASKTN